MIPFYNYMTVSLSIWRRWNECENVFTPKECKMSFPCCLLSGAGLPFKYVSFFTPFATVWK